MYLFAEANFFSRDETGFFHVCVLISDFGFLVQVSRLEKLCAIHMAKFLNFHSEE